MDEGNSKRKQAEEAIERAQQRAKEYNREKAASGPMIPPQTYNVAYGAIIVATANDLRKNAAVQAWLAEGAPLDAAPLSALGAPALLVLYALFQLAFSFGTGTASPFRLAVTKLGVTEPPFSSALNGETRAGDYLCSSCGAKLFDSSAKYDSGSGWPAFWRTHDGGVKYEKELLGGRMEVKCGKCDGHLGHVFSDGPDVRPGDRESVPASDPGGAAAPFALNDETVHPRFCVNGAALEFREREEQGALERLASSE